MEPTNLKINKKFYNSVMLKSKLTIAGSNFIFNHINDNYGKYLDKNKKLRVIFRGINIDYYNQKNISFLKQEKVKRNGNLYQINLLLYCLEDLHLGKDKKNLLRL